MITYKKIRRVYEDNVIEKMTCDLCGESAPRPGARVEDSWPATDWDILETAVSIAEGESYPDGGHKTTTSFDLCPKCFREKLTPWLEGQGAKARVEESDW